MSTRAYDVIVEMYNDQNTTAGHETETPRFHRQLQVLTAPNVLDDLESWIATCAPHLFTVPDPYQAAWRPDHCQTLKQLPRIPHTSPPSTIRLNQFWMPWGAERVGYGLVAVAYPRRDYNVAATGTLNIMFSQGDSFRSIPATKVKYFVLHSLHAGHQSLPDSVSTFAEEEDYHGVYVLAIAILPHFYDWYLLRDSTEYQPTLVPVMPAWNDNMNTWGGLLEEIGGDFDLNPWNETYTYPDYRLLNRPGAHAGPVIDHALWSSYKPQDFPFWNVFSVTQPIYYPGSPFGVDPKTYSPPDTDKPLHQITQSLSNYSSRLPGRPWKYLPPGGDETRVLTAVFPVIQGTSIISGKFAIFNVSLVLRDGSFRDTYGSFFFISDPEDILVEFSHITNEDPGADIVGFRQILWSSAFVKVNEDHDELISGQLDKVQALISQLAIHRHFFWGGFQATYAPSDIYGLAPISGDALVTLRQDNVSCSVSWPTTLHNYHVGQFLTVPEQMELTCEETDIVHIRMKDVLLPNGTAYGEIVTRNAGDTDWDVGAVVAVRDLKNSTCAYPGDIVDAIYEPAGVYEYVTIGSQGLTRFARNSGYPLVPGPADDLAPLPPPLGRSTQMHFVEKDDLRTDQWRTVTDQYTPPYQTVLLDVYGLNYQAAVGVGAVVQVRYSVEHSKWYVLNEMGTTQIAQLQRGLGANQNIVLPGESGVFRLRTLGNFGVEAINMLYTPVQEGEHVELIFAQYAGEPILIRQQPYAGVYLQAKEGGWCIVRSLAGLVDVKLQVYSTAGGFPTYRIVDPVSGRVLDGPEINPTQPPHQWARIPGVEYDTADWGIAWHDGSLFAEDAPTISPEPGSFHLRWINETPKKLDCPTEPTTPPDPQPPPPPPPPPPPSSEGWYCVPDQSGTAMVCQWFAQQPPNGPSGPYATIEECQRNCDAQLPPSLP